jgi:hypothetical protein
MVAKTMKTETPFSKKANLAILFQEADSSRLLAFADLKYEMVATSEPAKESTTKN